MSGKIKIVLLTDCLAHFMAGAERQIYELAKGLDKSRYEVTIASLECEGRAPRVAIEAIDCRLAVFPVKRIYGPSGWREGRKFYDFLKTNRIDILQTYHFSSDIWGSMIAKMAGVPRIISNRRDMGTWKKLQHILAYKTINMFVHRIVTNTECTKGIVIRTEGAPESKVEVLYNGVKISPEPNHSLAFRTRQGMEVDQDDIVITHVANIRPVKGHQYLLNAFAKVVKSHPKCRLILVGADRMNGQMKFLARELGVIDKVLFLGQQEDVREILRISDICVLPSLNEGMSNSILEYMAEGKPVVATNVGGNPELIKDEVNGLLVNRQNSKELAEAILDLIGDPAVRTRMGEKGLAIAQKKFSVEAMVQSYHNFYEGLFSKKEKKILHLISSGGIFGAENVVLTLAEQFNRRGIKTVLAAMEDTRIPSAPILKKAKDLGVEIWSLRCFGRFDLTAAFRLSSYIKKNGITILHTHNYKSDIIGALAASLARIPIVATAHGYTEMTKSVSVYEALDRLALRLFFKRVVFVAENMIKKFPEEKKYIVPNSISYGKFSRSEIARSKARQRFHVHPHDIVIGTVGRLSKDKNQILLLKATYKLMRANNRLKCVIVGEGPEETALQKYVASRYLSDKVVFTGLIHDIAPMYSMMDIFVLPSLTEGVPLTILEAMASKVPVIASRVGGIPGIIQEGKTGFLFESGNETEFASKIDCLIKDGEKREKIAEAAFDFVTKQYSVDKMVNKYNNLYADMIRDIHA